MTDAGKELLEAARYAAERFGMWKAPTANMYGALERLKEAVKAASGEAGLAGYAGVKDAEVNNSLPTQGGRAGDLDWLSVGAWMGFAASVIKSGEPWTAQCQREYDEAKAAFARLSALQAAPSEGVACDPWRVVLSEVEAALREGVSPETILAACRPSEGGEPVAWRWRLKEWPSGEWAHRDEYAGWADDDRFEFQPLYARPPAPSEEPLVGWRPIETAPKDGTEFIAYRPDQGVFVCRFAWLGEFINDSDPTPYDDGYANWFHDRWGWLENDLTPTHWMPWPAAPAPDAVRGGEG